MMHIYSAYCIMHNVYYMHSIVTAKTTARKFSPCTL